MGYNLPGIVTELYERKDLRRFLGEADGSVPSDIKLKLVSSLKVIIFTL